MNLIRSALPWDSMLDAMTEAVWLIDALSLEIVHVNRAGCEMLQWPIEEMIGQSVDILAATPQDIYRWAEPMDPGSQAPVHTQILRRDGRFLPVEQRITRIPAPDGAGWLMLSVLNRAEQEATERELESLLAELRATLDSAADGILVCGMDGGIRAFNHKLVDLWQLPSSLLLKRNDQAVWACMQEQICEGRNYAELAAHLRAKPQEQSCDILRLRTGNLLERRSVPLLSRGAVVGRIYSFRDITQEMQSQVGLRLAAQVFENSLDAIFIADATGHIVQANPACWRMLLDQDPRGVEAASLFSVVAAPQWRSQLQQAWEGEGFWEGSAALLRSGHSDCAVHLSWVALRQEDGQIVQSIGFVRDQTQQQRDQQRIEQLAFSDALTGLPNRLLLNRHVEEALRDKRSADAGFAILFLDLDRFKIINDSLGHQFGDRVLQLVTRRLQACLRPQDLLSRLGGDEFVLYVHACAPADSSKVAQRILQEMQQPFWLDGLAFSVQCSIGVAHYPQHAQSLDELIKQADTAMYRVKESGKGSFSLYEPAMSHGLLGRVQMEHALRHAIERQAMQVHYQPQVDMASGAILGAEALCRWQDAELGFVSPAEFIPLAEESGFIVQLGAWVLEQSIIDAATWLEQGLAIKVAVNVSSLEIRQTGFVERVQQLLERHRLPAQWLELELTETILLQQAPDMVQCIRRLAEMGVTLAIDDFGTGYSNLSYLKQLPIAKLKIDQSFVRGLPEDESDSAIVNAVLGLGRALKVDVVAEGVETEQQRQLLASLQCDGYQGYLCSPAVEAAQLQALLLAQQASRAAAL